MTPKLMEFTTPGRIDLEFKLALTNWIFCQNASQCRQGAHTHSSVSEKRGATYWYISPYALKWSESLIDLVQSSRLTHNQWRAKMEHREWNEHSFWRSLQSRLENGSTWVSWRPLSHFFLHLPSLTNQIPHLQGHIELSPVSKAQRGGYPPLS